MGFALGPRALSAGYKLAAFERTGSTNTEAIEHARSGERGPMWFVTSEQTAGRGRRQRAWIAPRGNLAASILEVMNVPPAVAATLGFAAGLAEEAALEKVSLEAALRLGEGRPRYALKWPNDVLVGGKKLVGIGLEAEIIGDRLAVVVGMGTNVVAAGGHADARGLAGRAWRPDQRRGAVLRPVRRLGRVPRHLGQWPRLCRDPQALAGAGRRSWREGCDQHGNDDAGRHFRHDRRHRLPDRPHC